ncbi:hypothetical protein [Bifidobacterium simiiventris]|uniref:hypothetical protein n=1 Tax=Bifidobacterium simiiventris TaxID=2834434 RepID=UPI001C5A4338|nr:hypothetical protein [Bifidobacterium simiiventris]MBW3077707.1 hypothetical protein [Bifidobacterium simiiventris]
MRITIHYGNHQIGEATSDGDTINLTINSAVTRLSDDGAQTLCNTLTLMINKWVRNYKRIRNNQKTTTQEES